MFSEIYLKEKQTKTNGFTLGEILVVLVIFAVLLALIMRFYNSTIDSAKSAKCLNNLRQVGLANIAFSTDNRGLIAAGGHWTDYWWESQIRVYLGGNSQIDNVIPALICPGDATEGWGNPPASDGLSRRSYAVNSFLRENGLPKRMPDISNPSQIVYAGDTGLSPIESNWINGLAYWLDAMPEKRHDARSNYVFLDGHAETFAQKSLYYGMENHRIFTGE